MSKCVVIGVTGGIAAYKALDIVSQLKKQSFDVHVIMTKSAEEFIKPLSFQGLSQNLVITDMFAEPKTWEIEHISLAKKADLMLVCPATANIIGKVAHGIADDMLSTTIMATKSPVVFAPAMNVNMFENPVVQSNINFLTKHGYKFIQPGTGRLACGDTGKGKLADTQIIVQHILSILYPKKDLIGKKVLVTAGPTQTYIDPVRIITNRSTGRMGYALAEEARDRGADVTLVTGPTNLEKPFGVHVIDINTNEEMFRAVKEHYESSHIVIKSAAVADYKVKNYRNEKIKKSNTSLNIVLEKDNDILYYLGKNKKQQILVGFAAESHNIIPNALDKLHRKNLDFIVANDVSNSFGKEHNQVTIINKKEEVVELEEMPKRKVAETILDTIVK